MESGASCSSLVGDEYDGCNYPTAGCLSAAAYDICSAGMNQLLLGLYYNCQILKTLPVFFYQNFL